jgi:hypothetical protein
VKRKPHVSPLLHEHHPVRVLLRRARRNAWEDCAREAFDRGLIRESALARLLDLNPWKESP